MAEYTFIERAKRQKPWLPAELLQIWADKWAETGSARVAYDLMRQSAAYDNYYAGNKRDDGSLRYDEQTYSRVMEGYAEALRDVGQNPDIHKDRFVTLLEGNVSVQRFAERLAQAQSQLINNSDYVRQAYIRQNGLSVTDPSLEDDVLFADYINPGIGESVRQRRLSRALIGGEALAQGFNRGKARLDELAQQGMDQAGAREMYQQIAANRPTLDTLAKRFYDPDDSFGIRDLEDALGFGDVEQQKRMRSLLQKEQASFQGRGSYARTQTGAGGLLQQ